MVLKVCVIDGFASVCYGWFWKCVLWMVLKMCVMDGFWKCVLLMVLKVCVIDDCKVGVIDGLESVAWIVILAAVLSEQQQF